MHAPAPDNTALRLCLFSHAYTPCRAVLCPMLCSLWYDSSCACTVPASLQPCFFFTACHTHTLQVKETSSWSEASTPVTQFDIKVTNRGSAPASSMRLLVTPPAGAELGNSWNSTRLPDDEASGAWAFGLPDWCAPAGLAPGADVVVGMIIKGAKPDAGAFVLA